MEFNQLHFAHSMWLWGLVAIPAIWLLFYLYYRSSSPIRHIEKFIDPHLLPHLLVSNENKKKSDWKSLVLWSILWTSLILAMAGPRWSFREIEMMSKDQSLVILLDLSESMNATDVKPSRLIRAKQKIEDLINHSKGVKIGLIAFAADPHMITPITDDKETIRHLLPSLSTDLVYVQGSRLSPALEMAAEMLDAEPGTNKALLIISDGDFEDGGAVSVAKSMADRGLVIHAMGVGTSEGAILQDSSGSSIRKNGSPVLSRLLINRLEDISRVGNGSYLEADHSSAAEEMILHQLETHAESLDAGKKNRIWDERFYLFILPVLPILLWWFRRGGIFVLAFFCCASFAEGQADIVENYFMNSEEAGAKAFDAGDYKKAGEVFQDPYRKGVAHYKAGEFEEAEKMFKLSSRPEVAADAQYNLGNAYAKQEKFKEAVVAYEEVLKKCPDHTKAKENLELIKKMMQDQNKDHSSSEDSDEQKSEDQEDKEDQQDKGQNQENDSDQRDSEENQDADQKDSDQNSDKQDKSKQDTNENQSEKNPNEDADKDPSDKNEPQQKGAQRDSKGNSDSSAKETNSEKSKPAADKPESSSESAPEVGESQPVQAQTGDTKDQKSAEDQHADVLLNRIENDPKSFLKNKFYIESKRNGTTEGIDPW